MLAKCAGSSARANPKSAILTDTCAPCEASRMLPGFKSLCMRGRCVGKARKLRIVQLSVAQGRMCVQQMPQDIVQAWVSQEGFNSIHAQCSCCASRVAPLLAFLKGDEWYPRPGLYFRFASLTQGSLLGPLHRSTPAQGSVSKMACLRGHATSIQYLSTGRLHVACCIRQSDYVCWWSGRLTA